MSLSDASTRMRLPLSSNRWEKRYREWEQKQLQVQALGDPSGPTNSWTQVLGVTGVDSADSGTSSVNLSVYRLNVSDKSGDYYMVLTDPTISPSYTDDGCNSAYFKACGWYTRRREITMSTTPQTTLYDHGPTSKITTTTATFALGAGLDGSVTAGYSVSWNQDSVTTSDLTSAASGIGHWVEDFVSENGVSKLPATSTNTFLSHQGAIFQLVPGALQFELGVQVTADLVHQPVFGSESVEHPGFVFDGIVSAPQFSVSPVTIEIPPAVSPVGATGRADWQRDFGAGLANDFDRAELADGQQIGRLRFHHTDDDRRARHRSGTDDDLKHRYNGRHAAPSVISGPANPSGDGWTIRPQRRDADWRLAN